MGSLAGNLSNPNVTDPRQARPQDLSGSEMGARLIAQGTRGLANGFQNYQQQNQQMRQGGGGGFQVPMAQQPNVQLPMGIQQPQRRGPNDLAFYGSSY